MIKNYISIIILFLLFFDFQFSFAKPRTSRYEFFWAMGHPFAALKVKKVYKKATKLFDKNELSIKLDKYSSGGKLDAFRHVYYMAAFAQKVKPKKLLKLGIAHEKTNYLDFKKGKQEDGLPADSLGGVMDLLNNEIGVKIGKDNKQISLVELKQKVIGLVNNGDAYFFSMDKNGNYLDCNNALLDLEKFKGKWFVPKCLLGYKEQQIND